MTWLGRRLGLTNQVDFQPVTLPDDLSTRLSLNVGGRFSGNDSGLAILEAIVFLISGNLTKCRRYVMRNGVRVDHKYSHMINDPSQELGASAVYGTLLRSLLKTGNGYLVLRREIDGATGLLRRGGGDILGMDVYESKYVTPTATNDGGFVYTVSDAINNKVEYVRGDVVECFLINFDRDTMKSVSPLYSIRKDVKLGLAIQDYISNALSRSSNSGPAIKVVAKGGEDNEIPPPEELLQIVPMLRKALENKRDMSIIMPGFESTRIEGLAAQDLAAVDMLKGIGHRICAVYRVSPARVGLIESSTKTSTYNEQLADFIDNACAPVAEVVDSAMSKKLLTSDERLDGYEIKTDLRGIGPTLTSPSDLIQMVVNGLMTPNEVRTESLGRPARDGGDDLIMPRGTGGPVDVGQGSEDEGSEDDESSDD